MTSNTKMKIYFGSDHAGFDLKSTLIEHVRTLGHEVEDLGPYEYTDGDDYPDYIIPVAKSVAEDPESLGIVIGGSGQGEAMAANKVEGIRAAVYYGGSFDIPHLAREHNNANILSIGARFIVEDEAHQAVEIFHKTPFSEDERHVRRLSKLELKS